MNDPAALMALGRQFLGAHLAEKARSSFTGLDVFSSNVCSRIFWMHAMMTRDRKHAIFIVDCRCESIMSWCRGIGNALYCQISHPKPDLKQKEQILWNNFLALSLRLGCQSPRLASPECACSSAAFDH